MANYTKICVFVPHAPNMVIRAQIPENGKCEVENTSISYGLF